MPALTDAVMARDAATVGRLIAAGHPLEERDHIGNTALLIATASNQFVIARLLVAAGADIFARGPLGGTAGRYAQMSRVADTHPEGIARGALIESMREQGFPFPAPHPDEVQAMAAVSRWPPPPHMSR
ncbi:MAG: hypothetical protein AB7P02_26420 [Alphaproteobacteria bacterium]